MLPRTFTRIHRQAWATRTSCEHLAVALIREHWADAGLLRHMSPEALRAALHECGVPFRLLARVLDLLEPKRTRAHQRRSTHWPCLATRRDPTARAGGGPTPVVPVRRYIGRLRHRGLRWLVRAIERACELGTEWQGES